MDDKDETSLYPPEADLNIYYLCVGRVAMGWAAFETRLNHTIWRLAGVEQYAGACLTAQIMAPIARFRALVALAQFRGATKERCKALNALSSKADAVARQRNRMVHDPAYIKDDEMFRLQVTADRVIDFEMKSVDLKDFAKLEVDISKLTQEFIKQASEMFAELPQYDDTSFQQSEGIEIGPLPTPDTAQL